jgi:MFS family permease
MGIRQPLGLFVSPLNAATGLGIVTGSFTLAVGQFVRGAAQPVFGVIADRVGPVRVMIAGGALLALGLAATPFMRSSLGLVLFLGVVSAAAASDHIAAIQPKAAMSACESGARQRAHSRGGSADGGRGGLTGTGAMGRARAPRTR